MSSPTDSMDITDITDIVTRFFDTARRHPDLIAVRDNDRQVSYAELLDLVRRVAGPLAGPTTPVGVLTSRSVDVVANLLGVLTAGRAYVPIDPTFPAARRGAMLGAAGCGEVIGPTLSDRAPSLDEPVSVTGKTPAYILFTSGSTAAAKPVAIPRTAIAAAVDSLGDLLDVGPGDRVLQFASLNWDTCFEEILPALTRGATLVFDDDAYSGLFPRFLRMVDRQGVTLLDLPTAFWHELVVDLTDDGPRPLPESVRTVVIGGEAARQARFDAWRTLPGAERVRLVNTYGCTETTLVTHAVDLFGPRADPARAGGPIPIGRPLPHVVQVIGDDGELVIGGPALATGYPGLPELTAERFVDRDGGRHFHTRDRVRALPDGVLLHEGRLDDELKVRGIRVSPGEVEAALCAHPGVAAAAVTGHGIGDHTSIVAYVVARPPIRDDLGAELLRHLRATSPAHLVPARVTVVPELAHTASGKLDRRRTHQLHAPQSQPHATETKEAHHVH
ncbi:amino acid adenylation domain-containing protein [Actinokineospora inagensis]|uniref:amino acid adenylation domain-containing protein n=1 Tax=Actinokineospora inagensis TaxID=103730 RepID=UPI0004227E0D|nr:amino acid adenylation domain-containing protein [Actinokineospora inagensis]